MNNPKPNTNAPVFKVKKPKLAFNVDKAKEDEKKLLDKLNNFRVTRKFRFTRDYHGVKKRTISENKVKSDFVKETFVNNPYTHVKADYELQQETQLFEDQHAKHLKKLEGKFLTSKKLEETQEQLNYELTQNLFSKSAKTLVIDKESEELQGTRGLSVFDCWDEDLDPNEWIALCKQDNDIPNAKCTYFKDGRYIWLDAIVLDYDEEKQRFLVEILKEDGNFKKYVSRLSLYFKKENFAKFKERIVQSKIFQQKAHDKNVFYKYVESIDDGKVSPMPATMINYIFKKVLSGKFKTKDFEINQTLASKMMQLIKYEYLMEMKKYYVIEELKDPSKADFFAQKKITYPVKSKKRKEYSIILDSTIKKNFDDKLKAIGSQNFVRNGHMHDALKLFQDKCFIHKGTILLDTVLLEKNLPFVLDDFMSHQSETFNKNKESLKIQWREYPLGDICDILRNVNFFMSSFNDIADYNKESKNNLKKFIYRIDLLFKQHLEDFLQSNFTSWLDFLQKFIMPIPAKGETWVVNDKPLLKVEIKCRDIEKEKRKKDKKQDNKEIDYIYMNPNYDEFYNKLTEPIRWLTNFLNSLDNLEADIVKVLGISPKKIFNLQDSDEVIHSCYKKVEEILKRGYEDPNNILRAFEQFNYLLEKPKDEIVKMYMDALKKKNSIDSIKEYLDKINDSISKLHNLYSDNHNTIFFQVMTKESKNFLVSKAKDIKKSFLKKVAAKVVKNVGSIKNQYKKLQDDLVKVPEKEEDLVELNKNIEDCDKNLEQLEKEIEKTYEYILIMEQYGEQLEDDAMINFWLLKVCPLEVRIAFNEGRKLSNYHEQAFLHKLEEEKKELENDISNYKIEFDQLKQFSDYSKVGEFAKISENLGNNFDNAKLRLKDFNRREEIFGIATSVYENLDKLIEEFGPYRKLWDIGFHFDSHKETWQVSPLVKLNHKKIVQEIEKYKKSTISLTRKFEEEDNINAIGVCNQLKANIQNFETNLVVIEYLTKDCMVKKSNNWKNLFNQIKIQTTQQQETLQSLLHMNVLDKIDDIEEFVTRAEREYTLEQKLNKDILEKLKYIKLELLNHPIANSWILNSIDDLQSNLDEFLNSVLMMKQSPYIGPIKKRLEDVEKKLIGIDDMLEEWVKCQRSWIYLYPIFMSEDLKKKMPVEKKLFDDVDVVWQAIMKQVSNDPCIFDNFDWEKTKLDFEQANKTLDKIQHSLSNYLENKREEFPRFYFLADDELIEIISKTKDPYLVTKYLNKCFEGINNLEFSDNGTVTTIISEEGEKIPLIKPVKIFEPDNTSNVERWLSDLEDVMKLSLKTHAMECYNDMGSDRLKWISKWPGQLVLAVNNIKWTNEAEIAIKEGRLPEFLEKMSNELAEVVNLVRTDIPSLLRMTLTALIVIDVHAKYVINNLIEKGTRDVSDFNWISQLRYTMTSKDIIKIMIMTATYDYQYEYLGNSSRLVITPLTDRCYRTLINAYQYFYGGAPEGPAGTGKTETVKDLAKTVAVQCVVLNCTDQINYVAMSKFFKGLSQTGAWCCFDEFNRIVPEVLSVIAVQVRTIQNGIALLKDNKGKFFFEGKHIKLIKSTSINITMNPGYAGRSELPDNLKALFRSCAMMVPDYSLIAEICLYSYGFQHANNLATKVVGALKLSSEQLSAQKHYDFGMRALKTILVAAGNLKRKVSSTPEDQLCLQALKDVNMPKFTESDTILFESIITDLFPGVQQPNKDWDQLLESMETVCTERKLIAKPEFLKKAIQIYETVMVRHGLMLVGETFSGKTECLKILKEGLIKTGTKTQIKTINPKAITGLQLYGFLDPDTKVWTEGVISQVMKECTRIVDSPELQWIVFDGPVDAEWIENMNTVLDDNKVLCLTNGQKIKLTGSMTMMFEVEDLNTASPATVSRCGMIYLEARQLSWETLITRFLKYDVDERLEDYKKSIMFNLRWFLTPILAFIEKNVSLPLQVNELKFVDNVLLLFKIMLIEFEKFHCMNSLPQHFENKLLDMILFSVIWGVGGLIDEDYRSDVNMFLLRLIYYEDVRSSYQLKFNMPEWEARGLQVKIKDSKNLFNMKYNVEKMMWDDWIDVESFDINKLKGLKFEELIIPTTDSVRNGYFVRTFLENKQHILMTGPTGTGKTIGVLKEIDIFMENGDCTSLCTTFSGQTLANKFQRQIEGKMTTRKGKKGHFGPEDNKQKMILYIDDLNMPAKDKFGSQAPIELLRMWMDHEFWYELDTRERKYLMDMYIVATMGPPKTGRNTITPRILHHFFLLYAQPFDYTSMYQIFNSILDWHFISASPKFMPSIQGIKENIVKATLDVFNRIKVEKDLLPTPKKSHYIFSLRDISRVFQTISKSTYRSFKKDEDFINLWVHECMRVFSDRLIDENDQNVFKNIMKVVLKNNFKHEWEKIVKDDSVLWTSYVATMQLDKSGGKKLVSGVYTELIDKKHTKMSFDKFLAEYNESNAQKLNLVLFDEAIEHIIRILRVMSIPNGHCLLVGLGGLGRKSLSALAAFIAEFSFKTIEMNSNFGSKEWVSSLQEILIAAGLDNHKVMFLFSDNQIYKEEILEDIVSLLNQGYIPELFNAEERMKVIEDIGTTYTSDVEGFSNKQKFEFFIKKCKENLHLSLCFTPVGEKFKQRLRNYPSFINNTTIDWFLDWPKKALSAVAKRYIQEENFRSSELNSITEIFVEMQSMVQELNIKFYEELRRYYYVTPKSYLDLLGLFKKIIGNKRLDIKNNLLRYQQGVQTLLESKKKVEEMKAEIVALEPKLKSATVETEQLISKVEKEQAEADKKRHICETDELICNTNKEKAEALRHSCKKELDEVEPLLEEASKNLKTIQRSHIDFIKQIKAPLPPIQRLFQGLCILYKIKNIPMVKVPDDPFKKKPDFATPARNIIMAKPDQMLAYLLSYNSDVINELPVEIVHELKELKKDPAFDIDAITKVSQAAGKIGLFLNTIVEIYDKLQIINPKRENLKQAEFELEEAEKHLKAKQDELKYFMEKIAELQAELKTAKDQRDYLDSEIQRCKRQMIAAEKLVTSLDSEKTSWSKNIEDLKRANDTAIGNSIIASGMIAYLGIFPIDYRQMMLDQWLRLLTEHRITHTHNFELRDMMSDELTIGAWTSKYKLPNDSYSIDNAVILTNSDRFSLMIDPQNQANRWIKNMEKNNNLIVLKPTSKANDILNSITNAIEIGIPVLFENVGEELDWSILSVLENKRKKVGKNWQFKFMDRWLEMNENFRFYITTKISKPQYSPEVCVMATMLNFQVTPSGLEDQLLNILVAKEDPNSEKARQNNIKEFYELKAKQKITEENILSLLTSNQEKNILDDVTLIDTLQKSKQDSKDAINRLKDIEMMKKKLLNTRNFYKIAANRASNLFLCVTDLGNIEPMYQFSLDWFIQLYKSAIDEEPKVKETRVADVIRIFTNVLFQRVCPSLFEKDKLLFSLLIYLKTLECQNITNMKELRFLFVGGTATKSSVLNPAPEILNDKQWALLNEAASHFNSFKRLIENIKENKSDWIAFFEETDIVNAKIPSNGNAYFNEVEHLILVRLLRTDKLISLVQAKIEETLGTDFVDYPSFTIESVFSDASNVTPIIFILSQGSEPLADIDRLANIMGNGKNVDVLSLGQGQEQTAAKAIEFAQKKGRWVVLQNCHLAPKFLFEIEKLLDKESKTEFRLWLTSMPTDKFPVTLLQKGFKITSEPPRGIKANMLQNYNSYTSKFLEAHTKPYEWKKLLFGVTFFHSVVQERRRFSSLGWNIMYEFSQMDLEISVAQLNSMLKDFDHVPWECLKYSIAEANYGGRVTDPMDRRLIKVILDTFFNSDVLEDNYKFSESGVYNSPNIGDISSYRNYIKTAFPLNDLPDAFGLHPNAEITCSIKESTKLMGTLLSLLPRITTDEGMSVDSIIMEKADQILAKLPEPFNTEDVLEKFPVVYENSMNTVLNQEIVRYNKLTMKIKNTLIQLRKAIEGFVIMTDELDEIYIKILNNQVSDSWHAHAYPSVKPLTSWFENYLERIKFISNWIENGQPNSFWISGFFFTQSFLTGVLQNYARKHQIAIDKLVFDFEVMDENFKANECPETGCYVYGLFIEGARWSNKAKMIMDPEPKVLFYKMPYIWLKPISVELKKETHSYLSPLYKTSTRAGILSTTGHSTNFVIGIDLPISVEHSEDFWIKRGVALLCELDD